jgi:threonine dehydrogenase-like Zn-dependent dehydrogenase
VTSRQARAFWIVGRCQGAILDEELPAASANDVVVRTRYSAVSRGTEALVFAGEVPDSERDRMRAPFQSGDFPAPVKYGYCNVGEVESGPADLANRTVFALYPHQTRYVVPASAAHLVPDNVPPGRAVLAANMETALNGVWDAHIRPGDRVAVVGAGTVGCLVAWLAGRIPGCEVCLIDVKAARMQVAAALGVDFAPPARAPADRDVVVHASGSPDGLSLAVGLAGFEATVLEMSWYGSRRVSLALGEGFHANRLSIRSSQVGHVAAPQRARWDHARRLRKAISLLSEPALDVLITGESAFEELPAVLPELASGSRDALCHRIRY